MSLRVLEAALNARQTPLDVFIRDDDAGWDMDALDRLLDVIAAADCPIDVAVIPTAVDHSIAQRLDRWRNNSIIGLHQHGYAHINHEPEGSRKCEFGQARPATRQYADIRSGRDRLADLLGMTDPIFTPPWNRCTADTAETLAALGFRMLSQDVSATPPPLHGLSFLPIDIDWCKHARVNGVEGPATGIARRVSDGARCVGIMLHHAAMSLADLRSVSHVLESLNASNTVRFRPMRMWIGG